MFREIPRESSEIKAKEVEDSGTEGPTVSHLTEMAQ